MNVQAEEDRIRAALSHVPADSRDTWVQMGMAVKAELGDSGFDLWDDWSKMSQAYSESDARAVWRSFKAGGITIATLFKEAIAHGYTESEPLKPIDPAEHARRRAAREQEAKEAAAQHERSQAEAADKARELWERAGKVHADHAYIRSKKIKPYGAKQLREQLVIRIQDVDGTHHSAQYIQADGSKTFQTGGRISGCFAAVTAGARPNARTPLLIAEGFATACSLHEATGYPVAAAMNAGNLLNVAKAWRAKYPRVRIVICADDDTETAGNPGMTKATEAARAVGALLAAPDFGLDRPDRSSDFNDLHALDGLDALRRCVDAATAPGGVAKPAAARPTALLTRASDIVPEAIRWLWPNWLPEGKLTLLAGSPGTGKTTLALALSATVSRGGKWPDGTACNRTGDVLIWSGEDNPADTLVPRLMAAGADTHRIHIVTGSTDANGEIQPFDPSNDIPLLAERLSEMGGAAMLIVDPIVSAVSGDAHRVNDVRRNLQALVDMAASYRCAVLGISHFAKGTKGSSPAERVIGSQAFVALARMVLVAGKDEAAERRILARAKSNIAPDDGGVSYTLEMADAGGIQASRVVWGDMIEGTARDILGDVEQLDDEERTGQDEAREFLASILSDGPKRTRELKADADGAGYNWKMMQRAASKLGVEKRKIGMKEGWEWALPKGTSYEEDTKGTALYTVSPSVIHVPFGSGKGLRAVEFPASAEGDIGERVTPSENLPESETDEPGDEL
ncbi:putative DNA primase/helicase [Paraburkholderia sp. BL18I3N2]|uniref:AAA family ATPase n=1 Tax=Paraburkholderia sp. BL18I3N2 TaxID=1938799 RepID=UPI000D06D5F2|nr:AAA family ATPase [Paraburkholderia sp. BL18I3N2]PRX26833.1 putative DNA primase/helicase [Paraburkholderia sp. BL18I3N2]